METVDWQAGRSLDAMIAERVQGWTRHPERMHESDNRTIDGVLYCNPGLPGINGGGAGHTNVVPYYSTDIAAAWQIVETLATKQMVKLYNEGSHGRWYWEFFIWTKGAHMTASADTAPL